MMVVISSLEIMESEFKMQKIQQLVGSLERLMELLILTFEQRGLSIGIRNRLATSMGKVQR